MTRRSVKRNLIGEMRLIMTSLIAEEVLMSKGLSLDNGSKIYKCPLPECKKRYDFGQAVQKAEITGSKRVICPNCGKKIATVQS